MNQVEENIAQYGSGSGSGSEKVVDDARPVRLFRNGANQAVRIPKEFELPGQDALIWREGDRLIIEVAKPKFPKGSPQALLAALDEMAADGNIDDEPDPWADIKDEPLPIGENIFGDDEPAP